MKTRSKIIIAVAAAVVVVAGSVGGVLAKSHFDRENAITADVEEIAVLVDALYSSTEKENIAEDLTAEALKEVNRRIAEREENGLTGSVETTFAALKAELTQAEKMLQLRADVQALLDSDGALTKTADVSLITTSLKEWEKEKPVFYEAMMKTVAEAKNQKEEIDVATEAVTALFSDYTQKTVREDITVEEASVAKEKAGAIRQTAAKEALLAEVALVEEYIREREEAAAAAAASKSSSGSAAPSTHAQALAVAQGIADSIGPGTDLERVSAAARAVSAYYYQGVHKESGPYYSSAYGVFIAKESSCAGCTRALGMVLTCMGYQWTHVNENQWTHQWCRVVMDGQTGYADGQVGWAGYGPHPVE